ncbi:MAG: hypothetical protein A2X86_16430 [Bdellovibrionales bacterium GWA2_49_15]|nr:MAG: hypothetical protein A2X86_16430 [Bdellovibrionales bacterium GWA2_49_15]HAZ13692.1 hypothetical protein [Bdellovibrionales bacterium]
MAMPKTFPRQSAVTEWALAVVLLLLPIYGHGQSYPVEYLNSPYVGWGVSKDQTNSINLANAWKIFKKNKEIVVAVVDTGIDPLHPFIKDNLWVPGVVKNAQGSTDSFGMDFAKGRANANRPYDSHGHGTHVAGIVKSIFPDVKILVLKYYNPEASGQDNLNSTIDALRFAVKSGVDIINYSGGGPEPSNEELAVLKEAEKKGILVVAASGNDEQNIDKGTFRYYPASYGLSNILTVTTHDENLKMLASSNYGPYSVDIAAPGNRIKSSLPYERAGFLTGTSQATAFVSGVAALLKAQYPDLDYHAIKNIILKSARKEPALKGMCNSEGRLDAFLALGFAAQIKNIPDFNVKVAQRMPNSRNMRQKASGYLIRDQRRANNSLTGPKKISQ